MLYCPKAKWGKGKDEKLLAPLFVSSSSGSNLPISGQSSLHSWGGKEQVGGGWCRCRERSNNWEQVFPLPGIIYFKGNSIGDCAVECI